MRKKQIDISKIFDCNDLALFASTIVQTLPYHGISKSKFYICELHGVRFLTKLSFYRKTAAELYGKKNVKVMPQPDAELQILRLFRENIIENNITPCILELITDKVCTGIEKLAPDDRECEKLIVDYEGEQLPDNIDQLFCRYNDFVKHGLAHNKCVFMVLEKCDMPLDEYLQKSVNSPVGVAIFKSILFMVIHAFYSINFIYPKFRHYDLHTDNIIIKFDTKFRFKGTEPKFLVFHIDGIPYVLPYFGLIPKVIDFAYSVLPEEGIYSNIIEDRAQMYYRADNDLLYLFHWIYRIVVTSNNPNMSKIESLLSSLEPNGTYKHHYTSYIRKIASDIPSYHTMLRNKVFDEYRNYKVSPGQIHAEYTGVETIEKD